MQQKKRSDLKPKICVLTGAGISAESGLSTFRAQGGLWEQHRIEDVASLEGFCRNPRLVQSFYNMRRKQVCDPSVQPNAAHKALVELERNWQGEFLLVTQNVDDLHERAGSRKLIHMHGELLKVRCQKSNQVLEWKNDIDEQALCPCCQLNGTLRPHIVWFGEMPLQMDEIHEYLSDCDIFISVGTSGQVYPAAGFVAFAKQMAQARTIEVNMELTPQAMYFDEKRTGSATQLLPLLVQELLSNSLT
jgi:NAD-dependent deacetylase